MLRIRVVNVRNLPPGAEVEYLGREAWGWPASPLGNPFRPQAELARSAAIALYRHWLKAHKSDPEVRAELNRLYQKLTEQGELTLGCWCAPKACHTEEVAALLVEAARQRGHQVQVLVEGRP